MKNILDVLEKSEVAISSVLEVLPSATLKTVRLCGDYPFHSHENCDEIFVVLKGELEMDREGLSTIKMKQGDVFKVPCNLRHRTRTKSPCDVLLIGPK